MQMDCAMLLMDGDENGLICIRILGKLIEWERVDRTELRTGQDE